MKLVYEEVYSGLLADKSLSSIIFLHGLGEWRKSWKIVGPKIAELTRRKAYALDARNHGESPWTSEMTYDVMAEDLKEFMEDQAIDRAVIVGFSMGGRTAICFALKYPKRVDCLVIEDMTPSNVTSKNLAVHALSKGMRAFLNSLDPGATEEELKRAVLEVLLSMVSKKLLNHDRFREMFDPDFFPFRKIGDKVHILPNIDMLISFIQEDSLMQDLPQKNRKYSGKTLFLYGSKPFFKLDKDPNIKKLFPAAVTHKVEGASHTIHWEFPNEYVQIVSEFIQKSGQSRAKY